MIASIGPNLPQDLLAAATGYSGPIAFDPDRPVRRAADWLESKFAPWAFRVLEGWADGEYDDFTQVVFSRADDSAQRLYYYVCELQARRIIDGPEPLVFDLAKIERNSSVARTADQVRMLSRRLGVDNARLEQAIVETNGKRASSERRIDRQPCLLCGTPAPDLRLHNVIAQAGFAPVGTTLSEDWVRLGNTVEEASGDPAMAIAKQLHAEPNGPRSMVDPADRLRERLRSSQAQAAILWRIEEDEAETWHLPAQKRVLEQSGIPHLILTRRDWLARDGAGEEISVFLEGLPR